MKERHIKHLYWRAGFGVDINEFKKIKNFSKRKILNKLFRSSKKSVDIDIDLSEFSSIKNKTPRQLRKELGESVYRKLRQKSQGKVRDLSYAWIDKLAFSEELLREKMTLFWANVFVCRDNQIFHIQQYNNTLRRNALGDFRTFVKEIAREPSMSKYLNNNQNRKKSPNENFARELMELFTLGVGHYTEQDIKESARAFTGWSFKNDGTFFLREKRHDYGEKTFFGKNGNFDGDDIIDIILEQRQCAKFICTKIYKYFINPDINEKYLEEITNEFYRNYDIRNLMYYIFRSDWFYNDENIGVKIKSPVELLTGIRKVVPVTFNRKRQLSYLQRMMGQVLLYPENVSGWKGGKSWIDSNTLMFRLKLASLILNDAVINLEEKGAFEDSFEAYYKRTKKNNKFIKTTKNWELFNAKYERISSKELMDFLLITNLDKDTEELLDDLEVKSNRNFCIQLMSVPEYQLC